EAERRVRQAVRREQSRDAVEVDVAVGELAVREINVQRVEARRVELALVVGQGIEHAARRVVRDARETADRRARERRSGRDDRLPEELQAGRLRADARARSGTDACGKCNYGCDSSQAA